MGLGLVRLGQVGDSTWSGVGLGGFRWSGVR